MRTILIALMLITQMAAMAQKPTFTAVKDTTDGQMILNGLISFTDLDKESSFTWLAKGKKEYEPDERAMKLLQFYLRQYTMVVFLGTWCDDSHNMIPKLEKVIELLKYPKDRIPVYGLDRDKQTPGGIQKKYGIKSVPTIILLKDGEEVGRITETVKASVEADLSALIQTDMAGQQMH